MGSLNPLLRRIFQGAVAYLPEPAQQVLTRYSLFLLNSLGLQRIPVVRMRGHINPSGQVGTLLVAGHDPWVGYLPGRFFVGQPQKERVGNVWVKKLPALMHSLRESADLTIIRMDRMSATRLSAQDYHVIPEWVGMRLAVPHDLDRLVRENHSIREDMRLARRHKLYPEVTQGREQLDQFYDSMYVPFSRARYGALAAVRSRQELRGLLRTGGILWVMRDKQPLAGMLFTRKQGVLDMIAIGLAPGDLPLKMRGIMAALYYFNIAHARLLGCTHVDFRGARPSLHDGLFRYKRKWGNILYEKTDTYYDLLVRWNNVNDVVKHFLSHTSLIFRDGGGLSAIHADTSQSRRSLWIEGLHRLYLLTESGRHPMMDDGRSSGMADAGFGSQQAPTGAR